MDENEDRLVKFLKWMALGVGGTMLLIAISAAFTGCTMINPVCFSGCSASKFDKSGFILSKDTGVRRSRTSSQPRRL